jgi:hypothetical protein
MLIAFHFTGDRSAVRAARDSVSVVIAKWSLTNAMLTNAMSQFIPRAMP